MFCSCFLVFGFAFRFAFPAACCLWPPTDEYFSEQDEAFAQKVSDYWLEFARSASDMSESIAGNPTWPKHQPATSDTTSKTMGFGKNSGDSIQLEPNFMIGRMSAFAPILKDLGKLVPGQAGGIHSFEGVIGEEPKKKSA